MYTDARATEQAGEPERREPEPRAPEAVAPQAAAVLALQRSAGNQATQALIGAGGGAGRVLARDPDGATATTGSPDFASVIADESISGIKAIDDFRGATDVQRVQMIDILLDQFWVG